jgi:MYXO-CTERM domain-containing protein
VQRHAPTYAGDAYHGCEAFKSGGAARAPVLRWVLLALVLLAPVASAQETLDSLEEPHAGTDRTWEIVVEPDEAGEARALVFRNPVGKTFTLVIYDANGTEIFIRNGTRGIQTLPGLSAGPHRFFVRGEGEFQVTNKAFERILKVDAVNATLEGTDAYILAPSKPYDVRVEGDVRLEWWPLAGEADEPPLPLTRAAATGNGYVFTLRGDEGAAYSISLTPGEAPATATNEAPGPGALALAALVAIVALTRRT